MLDPVPIPRKYGDARVVLAQTSDALDEANARLVKSRMIYRNVRKKYAGQK